MVVKQAACEQEKLEATIRELLENAEESHASGARFVGKNR